MEYVHPIDHMDMKIDKLVVCAKLKLLISLTRGGLGIWNLHTGVLDYKIPNNAGGKTDPIFFNTWSRYQSLLCDNLKKRMVLHNFFFEFDMFFQLSTSFHYYTAKQFHYGLKNKTSSF
jgi:hypothetical protein